MLYEKTKAKNLISDRAQIKRIVQDSLAQMAGIVSTTLGPGGRTVLIERDNLAPLATKDGVTVAKALGVANAEASMIMEAAKEICLRTAKEAGDGTTTAIILANAFVQNASNFLEANPRYNPQRMISELNRLYETVVTPFLKTHAKPARTREELVHVATISANGDEVIANAAVDAVMAAGEDGQVLVEEADDASIRVETMEGCIATTGLKELGAIGLSFINDRSNQQAKMDNGIVFLFDGSLNDLKVPAAIQQAVEGTSLYGKPLMVFAHHFSDVVLDKFARSTKGGYTVVPVKTPMGGVANSRSMFLYDMAAYTGATVIDPASLDERIEEDLSSAFGEFTTAKVNLYETFVTAEPDSDRLEARIAELKSIAQIAPNDRERMFAKAAISKLTGGVSTIWVGGGSELEAREKKARVEDAVEAVRSAIAEGIIPGGCGVQLVLADIIRRHPDRLTSWDIMEKSLREPFRILLANCGEDFTDIWNAMAEHIVDRNSPPVQIFDANSHRIVDPYNMGIIEPSKVCRVSIGNALSVASILSTLGGLVVSPRDSQLEQQLALSKSAFREMMSESTGTVGQE
jgi:chaperonin GroEL